MRKDSDREQFSADSPVDLPSASESHALAIWRKFSLWTALFLIVSCALRLYKNHYLMMSDDPWWDNILITGPGQLIVRTATTKFLPGLSRIFHLRSESITTAFHSVMVVWFVISGLFWLIGHLIISRRVARKSFRADG